MTKRRIVIEKIVFLKKLNLNNFQDIILIKGIEIKKQFNKNA